MDKCGEAIRALKESDACLIKAKTLCQEYGKMNGPAPRVKPDQHAVFRRLAPLVQRTLEKCERENGLMYDNSFPNKLVGLSSFSF